tara:strand:- start:506 stop:1354 length:849 start_codon:yes stop_codon:yes gene_type:complete
MNVLITGSSGFVGSNITRKLEKLDHNIFKADRDNGIDILKINTLNAFKQVDVCLHLAAATFVPESYFKSHKFFSLNVYGLINCLEFCRRNNAKLIFISSYVYGKPKHLPIDESHRLESTNPYSETKLIGEKICKAYNKYYGLKSIILRPSNLYGPGQDERFLVPTIFKQAKSGKIFLKDPLPKRDYIFVDDFVDCLIRVIDDTKHSFDIFNVGYGKSFSIKEIVQRVNNLYDNNLDVFFDDEKRTSEISDNVLNISKIKKAFDWRPKIDLDQGLSILFNASK